MSFFQHCDEVITKEYPGMKGKSQVSAEMTGEEVKVKSTDPTVIFDKSPMQVCDIVALSQLAINVFFNRF